MAVIFASGKPSTLIALMHTPPTNTTSTLQRNLSNSISSDNSSASSTAHGERPNKNGPLHTSDTSSNVNHTSVAERRDENTHDDGSPHLHQHLPILARNNQTHRLLQSEGAASPSGKATQSSNGKPIPNNNGEAEILPNSKIGLRAPINIPASTVTHLGSLYGHSNRSAYLYYCEQYDVTPNTTIVDILPPTKNQWSLTNLSLQPPASTSSPTIVATRGMLPLLEVLSMNKSLEALELPNQGIGSAAIEWLASCVLAHPTLSRINLAANPISNCGMLCLCYVAKNNPRVIDINVEGCCVDHNLVQQLNAWLTHNRNNSLHHWGIGAL
eukprot:TRINITY_DN119_c0_g2_i1.p1 TRINITY_DN119_c0_g2~~TRINITY_DN119_c0_g2_i1.p1  ORF type:complete len:376 (-),score=11.06 TRINITY_DN119_c0_g2_i1:90-1070(-)